MGLNTNSLLLDYPLFKKCFRVCSQLDNNSKINCFLLGYISFLPFNYFVLVAGHKVCLNRQFNYLYICTAKLKFSTDFNLMPHFE